MYSLLPHLGQAISAYLPYLWLKQGKSAWLLVPAAGSLVLFAWLLSLHPTAAGRVYAAYGGVYIGVAVLWLWLVDGITPTVTDWAGVGICLFGMAVIMSGPKGTS
nr:YnfA family protein [uncultured Roseateles sp.]